MPTPKKEELGLTGEKMDSKVKLPLYWDDLAQAQLRALGHPTRIFYPKPLLKKLAFAHSDMVLHDQIEAALSFVINEISRGAIEAKARLLVEDTNVIIAPLADETEERTMRFKVAVKAWGLVNEHKDDSHQ